MFYAKFYQKITNGNAILKYFFLGEPLRPPHLWCVAARVGLSAPSPSRLPFHGFALRWFRYYPSRKRTAFGSAGIAASRLWYQVCWYQCK
jgi:hypothetical protein